MDTLDKKIIQKRYNERLSTYGPGIQALASGTHERRSIRFSVLSDIGIEEGCSVLDVGCGFADFFSYLKSCGVNVAYTGIDIVPELIESAKKINPSIDIQVRDLQEHGFPDGSFDYVVSSQVFNFNFGGNKNYNLAKDMMRIMYKISRRGVAIDFLSSYVDFRQDQLHYYDPELILSYAKELTRRVTLRHDYPLFEFCIYLYPTFKGWQKYE